MIKTKPFLFQKFKNSYFKHYLKIIKLKII